MSAAVPATVLGGKLPGGRPVGELVLIEEMNAQLSAAKARRKSVATVLKSGFLLVGMPVSHAWKQ